MPNPSIKHSLAFLLFLKKERILIKTLKYIKEYAIYKQYALGQPYPTTVSDLYTSFDWSKSTEGYNYWSAVCDRWMDYRDNISYHFHHTTVTLKEFRHANRSIK